jgi:hypothetical protein
MDLGMLKQSKLKGKGIKERRYGFSTGLSRRNGKRGIMKGFRANGAKLISTRKGKKENNDEYLCG